LGDVPVKRAQPQPFVVVRNGTDNASVNLDYANLETPAVMRRGRSTTVEAMKDTGMDVLDIPAFLRKQAD